MFVWVGQTLLAVIFAVVGPMKFQYASFIERRGSAWARDLGPTRTRLTGLLELACALGLVLPLATRAMPWLTPIAGACLALMMGVASIMHTRRGETQQAGVTVLLGLLAILVTIGIVS